ncbi:MAG: hypothetical protein ABJ056_02585 [Halioglobus sp.]
MLAVDLSTGEGISAMIGYSVRLAIPFIYLAMAASSFNILFPSELSRWWLRNRRYIGLCFAAGMAWQAVFIFTLSTTYRTYYAESVYYFRDELEGSVGYIFLGAMVLTSFALGRKHVNQQQWKIIQKGGIYCLWAYAFSVYWWNLYYYDDPRPIDYLYYWGGFFAFALRIAAWGKQRQKRNDSHNSKTSSAIVYRFLGGAIIVFGVLVAATGLYWQAAVTGFLTSPEWSAELELWLPFWPFEPFLPLLAIGLGTAVFTKSPIGVGNVSQPV